MWWAWPRRTDVYLAQGLALAGTGDAAAVVVRLPATFPAAEALRRLVPSAPALFCRGTRLRIRLSAALCPPVRFEVPREIGRWAELRAVATAHAAKALEMHAEDVTIAIDAAQPGCIAALPRSLREALEEWSRATGVTIVSLAPLWREASLCRAVLRKEVQGFRLREADGESVIACPSATQDFTLSVAFGPDGAADPGLGPPSFLRAHWTLP